MSAFKHLRAIVLLPVMVTVVFPTLVILYARPIDTRWPEDFQYLLFWQVAAGAFCLLGLALLVVTNLFFAKIGKGTLAPWDPTQRLVVEGPYRSVRNPMISGVAMILLSEAAFTGSAFLLGWALFFLLVNHLNFLFIEEPGLEKRFGDAYRRYKANVPRWIPRKTPWDPHGE